MATSDIKTDEKTSPAGKIVEQRVKPTIIRRRKVPEESVEAAPVVAEEEESAASVSTSSAPRAPTVSVPHKKEEGKRKSLTIIAEAPGAAPKAAGTVEAGLPAASTAGLSKDADLLAKKVAKKKKSRAELQLEDIQKMGGLKQYVLAVTDDEPTADPVAGVFEPSRVFEPGARTRKKKAVKRAFKKTQITEPKAIKKVIKISEGIVVSELSQAMGIKASEIVKKLMDLGTMVGVNQTIDKDAATLIATDYGYEVESTAFKEEEFTQMPQGTVDLQSRAPVVTVMGHVDHGKTSILDVIRSANVAEGEAGGITQHIGAYTVVHKEKAITFVDTPGHEAFTHMRARGASVTDIVVLVVAADDGVMPQTKEAVAHAKAAGVPIVVAINKVDKPNANVEKVKRELSDVGLLPEDWGGQTLTVLTSAKKKEGIDSLLETILLQAEVLELKARRSGRAAGVVIESQMDKQRGPVVTAIVKEGILQEGDFLVCGHAWGTARLLVNSRGEAVKKVFPSEPVEILGLAEVPEAGANFIAVEDEKAAKVITENRLVKRREEYLTKRTRVTLEDLKTKVDAGEAKELNIIIKTDVKGVAEAVKESLPALSTKDVKICVLHTDVGGITENDVMLARASHAVILGFNVVSAPSARELAKAEGIDIKHYSIIYEMLDDVKKAITGMLQPRRVETVLGRAQIKETFKVSKVGTIAGCSVTSGRILRTARVRLLRDNTIVYDGKISSLKRFKDDAKEVAAGQECGIGIEKFNDIRVGDEIEAYAIEEIAVSWEESKGVAEEK